MKNPLPTTSKNLSTGVTTIVDVDPHVYTSVHQWRPISAERFVALLHEYMSEDRALDDFNHGKMHSTGYNLDRTAEAQIFYIPKEADSPISSPVLMTMRDGDSGKVICFASTRYGKLAGQIGVDEKSPQT